MSDGGTVLSLTTVTLSTGSCMNMICVYYSDSMVTTENTAARGQLFDWQRMSLWACQTLQEESQDYVNVPEGSKLPNPHSHLSTSK